MNNTTTGLLFMALIALVMGVFALYQHHISKNIDEKQKEGFRTTVVRRSSSPTVVVSRPSPTVVVSRPSPTVVVSRPSPVVVAGGGGAVATHTTGGPLDTLIAVFILLLFITLFVWMIWSFFAGPAVVYGDDTVVVVDDGPNVVYV